MFRESAELGVIWSPFFIIEILVEKHLRANGSEQENILKECYFWTLIAKSYSSLYNLEEYDKWYIVDRTIRYNYILEERMSSNEIQDIQIKAGDWWEAHCNDDLYISKWVRTERKKKI